VKLVAVAVVVALALCGLYTALDGGDFEPTPVADACAPRERPSSADVLDPAQRATLAVLDGAACDLGVSREQALLDLLDERNPDGVSDERLQEAVLTGIERAEDEQVLSGTEASVLRFAVNAGGVQVLLDQLRG
jgi:hypothetical protein